MENTSKEPFLHEHGLSLVVEYNDRMYLLDTGTTGKFAKNAELLGMDLSQVDAAVLSHAHYDHSGGFQQFFEMNSKAKLYLRETAGEDCYEIKEGQQTYIGIPEGFLQEFADRIVYINKDTEISKDVWLIGHHTPDLVKRGEKAHMYRKSGLDFKADDFSHEQSFVFDTKEGLVILNSCSHGGVDCIMRECMDLFPGKKVLAMIGGFHLMGAQGPMTMSASESDIRALAERIRVLNPQYIYTGHCTGKPAFEILQDELGDKLRAIHSGTLIQL